MFPIAHDNWTHPDQSSRPQIQCSRATDASSLAHQITNSSIHSFYAARGSRQIQFWIFPIGSEMIDPPEKLPHDHAYDAQCCRFANETPELFEHGLQTRTVGELESFASQLIERFAQGSASQLAVSSASAVLQAADEMKMAELHDPAPALAELDNAGNLVGDRGLDASVYVGRDRSECLRPALHVLSARQQNRIEEDGVTSMARFDRHYIQDPVFSLKAKVKSVQDQNQRSSWQAQKARARYKLAQCLTTPVSQSLRRKTTARYETFQSSPLHQDCVQKPGRTAPTLAASAFLADPPCSLALHALATSQSKAVDFGSATGRFRVRRIHARELATDSYLKYGKSQANYV
jgi:hypothetical protein